MAVIFSVVVFMGLSFAAPELQEKKTLADPVSLLSSTTMTTTGLDHTGSSYTLQDDADSGKILFEDLPLTAESIEITLGQNLGYGVEIEVCVQDESVVITGDDTAADYVLELPAGAEEELLLKIDGDLVLEDVLVSGQAPVETNQEEVAPGWKLLVLLMAVNVLLFLLADHYRKRIHVDFKKRGLVEYAVLLFRLLWIPIAFSIAGLAFGYLFARLTGADLYRKEKLFCILAGLLIGCLVRLKGQLRQHFSGVFMFTAAFLSILILVLSPVSTNLNYNDGLHYGRALALSYGGNTYLTQADLSLIHENYMPVFEDASIDRAHEDLLNEEYEAGALRVESDPDIFQPENLAYLPSALGLIAGRVLHLSFDGIFVAGRLFNLLFYVLLCGLAISSLRYGRMLAALIALLPVNLYQGCSYTDEAWVFCWLFFGVCRYLGFLQDPERKWSLRETLVIAVSFLLGLLVKPVYLPVLLLLFVIPGERFGSRRKRWGYYGILSVFAAVLVILCAVRFSKIPEHPGIDMSTVLYEIVMEILPFRNSASYLTYSGYFPANLWSGEGVYAYQFPFADLWLLLLLITAFTEGSEEESRALRPGIVLSGKIDLGVVSCLSVFLIAAACDLSSQSFEGRYLSPLLLMILWLFRSRKCEIKGRRENVRFVLLILAMALFLLGAGCNAF